MVIIFEIAKMKTISTAKSILRAENYAQQNINYQVRALTIGIISISTFC